MDLSRDEKKAWVGVQKVPEGHGSRQMPAEVTDDRGWCSIPMLVPDLCNQNLRKGGIRRVRQGQPRWMLNFPLGCA